MSAHQFREDGSHYNGGAEFFGYGYRAIGERRLKMIRRWYRQGERRGQTEDRYFVDGAQVADYAAAVEALKTAPVMTETEAAALKLYGPDFAKRPEGVDHEVAYYLRAKGFIEPENGLWRRVPPAESPCHPNNGGWLGPDLAAKAAQAVAERKS